MLQKERHQSVASVAAIDRRTVLALALVFVVSADPAADFLAGQDGVPQRHLRLPH